MDLVFHDIDDPSVLDDAAKILHEAFDQLGKDAWPSVESAREEVTACIGAPNICIGAFAGGRLCGWIGARPMYEKTWELHPMVIEREHRRQGVGRRLLAELERRGRERGLIGIVLGTDDETGRTSLSRLDLDGDSLLDAIQNIRNIDDHPYEFYLRCGYRIVGVVPDANGERKPDIWMWKKIG